MMDTDIIVALIGLVGIAFGAVLAGVWQKRKTGAEADRSTAETNEQIRETVMQLIEPLRGRVAELEKQVIVLREENDDLKNWAEALVCQLRDAAIEPVKFVRRKRQS